MSILDYFRGRLPSRRANVAETGAISAASTDHADGSNGFDDDAREELRDPLLRLISTAEASGRSVQELLADELELDAVVRYPTMQCLGDDFLSLDLQSLSLEVEAHLVDCAICSELVSNVASTEDAARHVRELLASLSAKDLDAAIPRVRTATEILGMADLLRRIPDRERLIVSEIVD